MNAKSLGTILREWRIERDLTQAQLGRAAGLSRKIVGSIELGSRKIVDYEEVIQICRALGRSVEELVLHWSRSTLDELQEIEREMLGTQGTSSDESDSEAPAVATNGSIKEKVDKLAALIEEIIHTSQGDLIQKLQLQMGLSGAPSPPPAAPRRPRSRVSRKGRVRGRNDSDR